MIKSLTPLTLAALIGMGGALAAQESESSSSSNVETAQVGDSAADQILDLGEPVGDGSPQLGDRYSKETHGDWDLACVKTNEEADPCSLLQVMKDPTGNPMAEISLFRIEQNGGGQAVAGATIVVPLETLLATGISISVDGAPGKRYSLNHCSPVGCYAQIGLTEADIAAYKQGKEAVLSLRPALAPDNLVELSFSLAGFTSGYKVVDVVKQ